MLQRRTEEVMGSAGALQAHAARTEREEEDRKHDMETMESWRKAKLIEWHFIVRGHTYVNCSFLVHC